MKIKSITLLALLIAIKPANASLLDFLTKRFLQDSFSTFHGEGLPKTVGKSEYGKKYRENFMATNNIYSEIDELGIEQFINNDIGLALIKRGNGDEAAFKTVLDQGNYQKAIEWKNGPEFIKVMKEYTEEYGCIPKIISLSHGWVSEGREGEGNGLTGDKGINGIFASADDLPRSLGRIGTRSLEKSLAKEIERGNIKFCNSCVAQFYACNIGAKFASSFSRVTGCQAVVATGQNSPWFQSFETPEETQSVFKGAHYWKSEAGVWAESNTMAKEKGYDALGTWYRSTPIKDLNNNVIDVVSENLGKQYISL